MPLFEYRCAECAHLEEVLQKYNDPAPEVCPSCGAHQSMSREVSLTSFQLKGGGWYKDLYASTKKDDKKADGSASSSSDGGSSSGGEKKSGGSDKKSADKPASKSSSGGGTKAA